ncbi:MAG: MAPEG family protein [Candidatus Binataceae bacterium]
MLLLKVYALTAVVLTFKMIANSVVQGIGRSRAGVFTLPEDAKTFGGKLEASDAPTVQRASGAWRNDLENIPIFLILGWIYVSAGGLSTGWFEIYCVVFVIARILHTIFYINAVQPLRTIVYVVGLAMTIAMAIHLLIEVAFA